MNRKNFEPFAGQRITVKAWLGQYNVYTNFAKCRNVITNPVQRPEVNGKIYTDHIWLFHASKLKDMGLGLGDYVKFEAEVVAYKKKLNVPNADGLMQVYDYQLDYPSHIELIESADPMIVDDSKPEVKTVKALTVPKSVNEEQPVAVSGIKQSADGKLVYDTSKGEPDEDEEDEPGETEEPAAKVEKKMFRTISDCIREALRAFGPDAETDDVVYFAKDCGYEDSASLRSMVCQYRRQLREQLTEGDREERDLKDDLRQWDRFEARAVLPTPNPKTSGSNLVATLEELLRAHGADKLQKAVSFVVACAD